MIVFAKERETMKTTMQKNVASLTSLAGAALVLAACMQSARATDFTYCGPIATDNEGWFNEPGNWTPGGGPPESPDFAIFDQDNFFNVYLAQPATTNKLLKISAGSVSFMMGVPTFDPCHDPASYELLGSGTFIRTAAIVGSTPGPQATFRVHGAFSAHCLTPAYVDVHGLLTLGQTAGSHGRLFFGRSGTDTGPVTWTSSHPTLVGSSGTGELEIPAGNTMINSSAVLGLGAGASGTADIRGTWTNNGPLTIGDAGSGALTVWGDVSNSGDCYIAAEPGSIGQAHVLWNAVYSGDWQIGGALYIGGDDGGPGGSAAVIMDGGHLSVSGDTTVWSPGSLTLNAGIVHLNDVEFRGGAELAVNGGGLACAALDVFYNGTLQADGGTTNCTILNSAGTVDVAGGTLNVSGEFHQNANGVVNLSSSGTINAGSLTGSEAAWNWISGAVNITNDGLNIEDGEVFGADLQIIGHKSLSVSDTLNVGASSAGILTVASGGTVESGAGVVGGVSSGGSAVVTDNNTSWTIANSLTVGGSRGTELSLANGASVSNNNAYLAPEVGTTAQVSLVGFGTQWDCGGFLYAGGDSATAGGTGVLSVDAGAHLAVGGTMKVWDDFRVEIDNGTVVTSGLDITGEVTVLGSGILDVSDGSIDLSGGGSLDGAIVGDSGTAVALHDTGSIWSMPGSLLVGANDYGSGHIHALSLQAGTTVTVDENVTVLNTFALTFSGGTINADSINVLDANFSGFGTLNGDFQAAGTVTATGDLLIGNITSTSGVQIAGGLGVGAHHVTLNKQGRVFLDSSSILGGTLEVPNGLGLTGNGYIHGFGVIDTPEDPTKSLLNDGSIVGDSDDHRIELLGHVTGFGPLDNVIILGTDAPGYVGPAAVVRPNVTYAGRLEIQIAGPTRGSDHDFIHADTVNLGGELSIELLDGFEPLQGDAFVMMTFESRTGEFDTVVGPEVDGQSVFSVIYGEHDVTLVTAGPRPGGCNRDGVVDLVEHQVLAECLAGPDASVWSHCACFDMNDSGTVDLADFALFQAVFGSSD
jgi:T5SS/PEP-CTERM-associated repeat protein